MRRTRVGFALSAAVTALYFAMVLVMALWPGVLAGSTGFVLSLGFILLTLVAMGGYSFWRIARLDE
jgi:uncharacterized membrane protein